VNNIANPQIWRIADTGKLPVSVAGRPLTINTMALVGRSRQRIVWWWYVVEGRPTASTLEAKLLQARAALRGGAYVGALVALSTETDDPILAADPSLVRFVAAMDQLPFGLSARRP
jgi:EpsI family protein